MNLDFLSPDRLWWLLAVAALAVAYVVVQFRRSRSAIAFSNLALLDKISVRSPAWKRHLIAVMQLAALALGVVAVAQPVGTEKVATEQSTIILAIDTSVSMRAEDVEPSRINAAKDAATAFVEDLPEGIKVGLVSFNGVVSVDVSPTTDLGQVSGAINRLDLDYGTSIGDAVYASLAAIDTANPETEDTPPAAIVLLSDGDTTVGRPTLDAVQPAVDAGVPVYTIAYGTADGTIQEDENGDGIDDTVAVPVRPEPLADLADGTGGTAFEAASEADLSSVYDELGGSFAFEEKETEISWKFLAPALGLLGVASVLALWWYQRIP